MVGAPSFWQPYLCIQPPLQSPPKICSSTSVNFHLTFPPLRFNKIILKIYINTTFLYTAAFFHLTFFAYNHPSNLHQNAFPTSAISPFHAASKDKKAMESCENCFFKVWTVITTLTVMVPYRLGS